MLKKVTLIKIKAGLSTLLFTAFSTVLCAQKLNSVQEGNVRAPANIKIDAKTNEWNDTYQAFNKATDIYYTMANDDNNLYLVVKSADQINNNKIIGGGINITINTSGKKKEKDAFVISFPVIDLVNLRNQIMQGMRNRGQQQTPDSAAIANMRKKAIATAKEIKLTGFKDIQDSVISIYNELGIKAIIDFDSKGSLVMEIAMPLKYLSIKAEDQSSFAYNIRLNGIQINAIFPGAANFINNASAGGGAPGGGGFGGGGFGGNMPAGANMPRSMADFASMLSPTDFWGKYTLAKK